MPFLNHRSTFLVLCCCSWMFWSCRSRPSAEGESRIKETQDTISYRCASSFSAIGNDVSFELGDTFYRVTERVSGRVIAEAFDHVPFSTSASPQSVLAKCPDDPVNGLFEVTLSLVNGKANIFYSRRSVNGARVSYSYRDKPQDSVGGGGVDRSAEEKCREMGFTSALLEDHRKSFKRSVRVGSCSIYWADGTDMDQAKVTDWARVLEDKVSAAFGTIGAGDIIRSMPQCSLYVAARPICLARGTEVSLVAEGGAVGF